jgi:hypothetical protein
MWQEPPLILKVHLCAGAWAAVLALASTSQAQVKLEWRLHEGETFRVKRETTHKQSVLIKAKALKEERKKTVVMAVTVLQRTPAGYLLEIKIESVKLQSAPSAEGAKSAPAASTPLSADSSGPLAAALEGSAYTATITPHGKLVKLGGHDDFIAKLAKKSGQAERVLRALIPEEALREEVEEVFDFLPQRAVRKGDKWKSESTEPVPPFGSLRSVIEYTLESEDPLIIAYKIKMSYRPPRETGEPFRIVKGSLKAEDGKGALTFDAKKGRLMESAKAYQVRGEVVVDSRGSSTQIEFTSENSTRVQLYSQPQADK